MNTGLDPKALAKLVVPLLPFILKITASHAFRVSETSSKWDLRTALMVQVLRKLLDRARTPVSRMQRGSIRDPGVKGNLWVSRYVVPKPPEDDARQLLFKSIDQLKKGDETYTRIEAMPVEAEWTGYRADANADTPEPAISEAEKYTNLMKEVTSEVTVLYFHGGAYHLLDPATHRPLGAKLAKLSGGRVLSVRYRLAPQSPFPAALLDGFFCYLSLLYPPNEAPHSAVSPSNITFSGDSAGGNLSLVLLQFILHLHHTQPEGKTPTVVFRGVSVPIPLPGGVAVTAPWVDVTRCMPSLKYNAKFDYLPQPRDDEGMHQPACAVWPTDPPRENFFCDGSALCHPLVSPLAAMDWRGAPPIYICCGQEMLADEDAVLARRLIDQGVTVLWEQYEAMPHVFIMVLLGSPASDRCFEGWANFCKDVVEGKVSETRGTFLTAKKLEEKKVDVVKIVPYTDSEVLGWMDAKKDQRVKIFKETGKSWPKL